ncbi:serine/threonine-protein kinase [Tundrisphaera sp. TA3]|uniref:serine/threonine-protein kinase n=1 Tax=Tundrisphaera sp. TA3 TaxID=3435775 RepID=UPI003EBD37D8
MTGPNEDRDARLAAALAGLVDATRDGRGADVEAAARLDPDLAAELRELWAAASLADAMASGSTGCETWASPNSADARPSGRAERRETAGGPPPGASSGPGWTIGELELQEEIGRGGMGVVHRAIQSHLGREVAVKRLLKGAEATPEEIARFQGEILAAARLRHPHILPVFEVGIHEGQPYLVMRCVKGTTLAARLAPGPMPAHEAATLLAPVAHAVGHAHDCGVLHRDLKPSNILIDEGGWPLVSDFGLAKRIDLDPEADPGLTRTGVILGTPSYMAPEQASHRRGPIGPAADVYGLGAILYHMLTGRPPFQAASAVDTLLLVLEQDPVPPRALNPRADPDLEMIALKCLQKSPELRYASARALSDDLGAYLAGEPVSARSTSLRALATRLLGETPHAAILENWGGLWMCHGVALVVFTSLVMVLQARGVAAHWPYIALFTVGLGGWAACFWEVRRRMGPITVVERQLAHLWGAGMIGLNLVLVAEWLYGLAPMTLAPILAVTNGMLFLVKAGVLSGEFYIYGGLVLLTMIPGILVPPLALPLFALVSAMGFFIPGLKYRRRRARALRSAESRPHRPG